MTRGVIHQHLYGLISFLFICLSCQEKQKSTVNLIDVTFRKEGVLQIYKSTNDSLITSFDIELAEDDYETQTGLMHRGSMSRNQAMLFIFSDEKIRSFYMKNTLIPLDIIYLNALKQVINIKKNAIPLDEQSIPSIAPAQYVLEIKGGLSDLLNIEKGDRISFQKK
ncbi:DUF192 domain-containing protein [Flavobacteriaceae bacterium]|jgi:uncharacterized membrane protein (UPF0127 family)|nr:DUF192 domain-containing protein [Flavobacteriaceae bacterium]MDC3326988.1 DUF192 domain-containing protein [Flavobacteriaceae bacterium]